MINSIKITFPQTQADWNPDFTRQFIALLSGCKNVDSIGTSGLKISSPGLKPVTEVFFDTPGLSVSLEDTAKFSKSYKAKGLSFGINIKESAEQAAANPKNFQTLSDAAGDYCAVTENGKTVYRLTLAQLCSRFEGKLKEVNHTGMNFSAESLSREEYEEFKNYLAKNSFLAKYPTGDEWPFIIPATENEFMDGIKDTKLNRNPKFEMVFDVYNPIPVIQFDVDSKLTQAEVMALLPAPYGVSFSDLADIFRSVFILTDIPGVVLRFDIGFRSEKYGEFYPWMLKEGGRIK